MNFAFKHKIFSIVLLCALVSNGIVNMYIVGDFLINQDFIAKTLCIQKEEQLGCQGKCHLAKQLKAVNTTKKDANSDATVNVFNNAFPVFFQKQLTYSFSNILFYKKQFVLDNYFNNYNFLLHFKAEKPPARLV